MLKVTFLLRAAALAALVAHPSARAAVDDVSDNRFLPSITLNGAFETLSLGGPFLVESSVVHTDDNDAFLYDVRNGTSWLAGWPAPAMPGSGVRLRTSPRAPVPPTESRTSALMLAGVAAMAFIVRRRAARTDAA